MPSPRVARTTTTLALLALALAGCGGSASAPSTPATTPATSSAPAASSPAPSTSTASTSDGVMVALGDSLAAGFQPDQGDVPDTAYPALARDALAARGTDLTLTNLACSGEDSTSFLGAGRCLYPEGSQLAAAEAALRAAGPGRRLVTVDIGGNDVLRCVRGTTVDQACAKAGLARSAKNLPVLLRKLRAAAGPSATIAVLTYYDPYVGLRGTLSPAQIQVTLSTLGSLNSVIRAAAGQVDAVVVDLPKAFRAGTPKAASEACRLTYVCTIGDIHLTAPGATVVANALTAAVAPRLAG